MIQSKNLKQLQSHFRLALFMIDSLDNVMHFQNNLKINYFIIRGDIHFSSVPKKQIHKPPPSEVYLSKII